METSCPGWVFIVVLFCFFLLVVFFEFIVCLHPENPLGEDNLFGKKGGEFGKQKSLGH